MAIVSHDAYRALLRDVASRLPKPLGASDERATFAQTGEPSAELAFVIAATDAAYVLDPLRAWLASEGFFAAGGATSTSFTAAREVDAGASLRVTATAIAGPGAAHATLRVCLSVDAWFA